MERFESIEVQTSKIPRERLFNQRTIVRRSKFGIVVEALWPDKPALNLAQRIPCSERAANFYITGERKPSARALVVIMDEID